VAVRPVESDTVPMVASVTSPASVSRRLRMSSPSRCCDVVVNVSVILSFVAILMLTLATVQVTVATLLDQKQFH